MDLFTQDLSQQGLCPLMRFKRDSCLMGLGDHSRLHDGTPELGHPHNGMVDLEYSPWTSSQKVLCGDFF